MNVTNNILGIRRERGEKSGTCEDLFELICCSMCLVLYGKILWAELWQTVIVGFLLIQKKSLKFIVLWKQRKLSE